MADFSSISSAYKDKSLVQASASGRLIELLAIAADADILDVGCGAGNVTATLRDLTSGRVVGVDQSEGMIRQARNSYGDQGIEFLQQADRALTFADQFDVVFCNSAFQWFREPLETLRRFNRALRVSGRVGIQAPACKNYCPNFLAAIDHCCRVAELAELFAAFQSPWFFLDSADEYGALLKQAGFTVRFCRLETVAQKMASAKVFDVFNSGAAAGYLNQDYFSRPLPAGFAEQVLQRIEESFRQQSDDEGNVDLVFKRIYAVAEKLSTYPGVPDDSR